MTYYLMTWKPDKWEYTQLKKRIERFNAGDKIQQWSCGTTRKIAKGSRIFLMQQGKGNGGLFGSGVVTKEPFEAEHYDEIKQKSGKSAMYIMVDFDHFYDPTSDIKISTEEIKKLDDKIWRSQGSGKKIPDDVAHKLQKIWLERTGTLGIPYPEDVTSEKYIEGAKKVITVNAYERNPKAREKCISHWGANCSVCNFHFMLFYGEIGRGYIHVHHLKPLADIKEEYELDPIKDLRPVCPNCHAMLHRKNPALSIEEIKNLVSEYGRIDRS